MTYSISFFFLSHPLLCQSLRFQIESSCQSINFALYRDVHFHSSESTWILRDFFFFIVLSLFSFMQSYLDFTILVLFLLVLYYIHSIEEDLHIYKNPLWITVYKSLFLNHQQDWTFAEGHHFPKWCRAGKSYRKYLIQLVTVNMRMCILVIV